MKTRGKTSLFLVFVLIILVPLLVSMAARTLFKSQTPSTAVRLDPSAFNSTLPFGMVTRICAFKESVAEVDTVPVAKTIALLEKEKDPAKEVAVWESIARTYREEVEARGIKELAEKKLVYRILVSASLRCDEDFIISAVPGSEHLEYLSEILERFRRNRIK